MVPSGSNGVHECAQLVVAGGCLSFTKSGTQTNVSANLYILLD